MPAMLTFPRISGESLPRSAASTTPETRMMRHRHEVPVIIRRWMSWRLQEGGMARTEVGQSCTCLAPVVNGVITEVEVADRTRSWQRAEQ